MALGFFFDIKIYRSKIMKIHTIFLLKWKSFVRYPLFEQIVLFRLLISVYLLFVFFSLYFLGTFLSQFTGLLFPNETDSLRIFSFSAITLLIFDFVLKFFFKKENNLPYLYLLRFPDSKKSVFTYILLKEIFSFWNYYLLIFFFSYLTVNVYPYYSLFITIALFVLLCLAQALISRLANYIKQNCNEKAYISVFLSNILPENDMLNYLLLNIKMIIRSPRLRQQFFSYSILIIFYFYLFGAKQEFMQVLPIRLFFTSILFILFPFIFNQFLFSAEAAFFDHLIVTPNFKQILPAKYILYLFFSSVSFLVLLFIKPLNWGLFVELSAIFLYSVGHITLLFFCNILFVSTKIDLFGSQYKMMTNPPSLQSLIILLIYVFSMALVLLISWLFSFQIAIYFMFVAGSISILFVKPWFNYLYRCFYPGKYEKMEIFRIQ
jgi:hypothetical protein